MLKVHSIAGPQDFQSIASDFDSFFYNSGIMMKRIDITTMDSITDEQDIYLYGSGEIAQLVIPVLFGSFSIETICFTCYSCNYWFLET